MELSRRLELLERDAEVRRLGALIAETNGGRGSVLLIEGPPGIGKSGLLEQAVLMAERAGLVALTAQGGELERDFAWGIARQLLEHPISATNERRRKLLLAGAARHAAPVLGLAKPDAPVAGDAAFAAAPRLYWPFVKLAAKQPLL